jgi:hypothetical protein
MCLTQGKSLNRVFQYNKPIPIVLGKHLYTPAYIGVPYTEIGGEDGEDQYFNALFLLGYSKLKVTDIKLGLLGDLCSNKEDKDDDFLVIDDNSPYRDKKHPENDPELELRQSASEVSLYPQKVFEEQLSIELTRVRPDGGNSNGSDDIVLEVPRFTAQNPMKVQVEFTFPQGLIQYNKEGAKQNASVEILIQWKKPQDSDSQWQPFGQIGIKPDGKYATGIAYSNGTSTITRQKSKVMRFIAERPFAYSEVVDAIDRTIELRIQRTNPQDMENTRISDKVYLTAIRTWCFDYDASKAQYEKDKTDIPVPQAPMIEKYRDKTCRLGFRIKAGGAAQGTIDALNCIVQSYGRVWSHSDPDNSFWKPDEEPTQNPASIALTPTKCWT